MKTVATAHEARFVRPEEEECFAISGGDVWELCFNCSPVGIRVFNFLKRESERCVKQKDNCLDIRIMLQRNWIEVCMQVDHYKTKN